MINESQYINKYGYCRRKHQPLAIVRFRLQELLKMTQNAEVVTSSDNYTPDAYTQNSKFIDDAQKEIYFLLEGIKRDVECI